MTTVRRETAVVPRFMPRMLSWWLAGLMLASLMLGSQPAPEAAAQSPPEPASASLVTDPQIVIGVAAATTGPVDWIGWRQLNAVQLAIDQANAAGGIDLGGTRHLLALAHADDGCDGAQAHVAANALLNAGAVAVIGHSCSSASLPAQPIYRAAGVPMVIASSTSPLLTEMGYDNTFRVVYRDDAAAELLATYLRQSLGMERVAAIQLTEPWAGMATTAFTTTFARLGGTITGIYVVDSPLDFAAALAAAASKNVEAVYYADGDANRAGALSSAAHDAGITIVAWDSMEADTGPYAAAGPAAEGDYVGIWGRSTADMPGYEEFNAAYQAAGFANFGDEGDTWGALAYDAANIVIAAIDRTDSVAPGARRDAIAATADYQGVVGTYERFDAKGDVVPQWVSLRQYRSGEWRAPGASRVFLPVALAGGP